MAFSPPYPDQARTIGALLRAPCQKLATRVYAELAAKGFADIRPAHSAVFRNISPDGSTLTELAEQAELTKQSMAYLVGYLEERGFVKVQPHAEDGRAKLVRLTKRGEAVIAALLKAGDAIETEIGHELGKTGIKQLRDLLSRLDGALAGVET